MARKERGIGRRILKELSFNTLPQCRFAYPCRPADVDEQRLSSRSNEVVLLLALTTTLVESLEVRRKLFPFVISFSSLRRYHQNRHPEDPPQHHREGGHCSDPG